jgi:hypothetical protein
MRRHSSHLRCALLGLAAMLPSTFAAGQEANDLFGDGAQQPPPAAAEQDPFGDFGAERANPPAAPDAPAVPVAPAVPAAPVDEHSVLIELPDVHEHEHAAGGSICRCIGDTSEDVISRFEKVLDSPLKSNGLDVTDVPLEEVVGMLQEEYGIAIQIDVPALEAIGLDPTEGVSVNLHNISLRSALKLMLKRKQLTSIIRDEVLLITTPEEADANLVTCVYDVRNLVEKQPMPAGASAWADFDPLVATITSCIEQQTWKENGGGEADIRPLNPGLLVVSQTRAIHDEIRGLLETIRDIRSQPPVPIASAEPAEPLVAADENETVTRAYILQVGEEGNQERVRTQVRELIMQSLPNEQWEGKLDNGQPVVLSVLPDRVVVKHKPSVQNALMSVLVESGVARPASGDANQARGGGGGFGGGGGREGGGFFRVDHQRE